MTGRVDRCTPAPPAGDTIKNLGFLERMHFENAISRYLVETKGLSSESFKSYLEKAKHVDQSVYTVICEIDNVMTYDELCGVFQSMTGIPAAHTVEGRIEHIKDGSFIESVTESEDGHRRRHIYAWHPIAIRDFTGECADERHFFLLKKDDFHTIQMKNGHTGEPLSTTVSERQLSREFIYPFVRDALVHGSTDIHIFPQDNQDIYKIRFRLLGDLVDVHALKSDKGRSLINVLINWAKEMTPSLKTDEKRRPLDGKIVCRKEDVGWHTDVDLRMSLIWKPDGVNSDVVLRILAKTDIRNERLHDLGYLDAHTGMLETAVKRNRGIILVTGPTGSGKSRTVNTLLAGLSSARCILCVEDPIEYHIPGGRQFQTFEFIEDAGSEKSGNIHVVGFSEFARAFKRHDPDVIFIGELRDQETVGSAIHLSKTGHLVLGTLHVSRAAQIPQMLVEDYGVSIDAVADNLIMGVNQVLVKKLCSNCKQEMIEPLSAIPEWMKKLHYPERDLFLSSIQDRRFHIPDIWHGCDNCRKTIRYGHGETPRVLSSGYSGRTVLGEAIEFRPGHFSDGKISGYHMEAKVETADMSHSILMDAFNKLALGTIDMDGIMRLL